jgi:hypothetical protein
MGVDFVMMMLASIVAAVAAVPPNILVLLTDDQGEAPSNAIFATFCALPASL